jgi:zinc protease
VLSNGVVAYLAEDHDFPLVTVSVIIRSGQYLDPKGKEGLAVMMASQMRAGGTTRLNADAFDEEAAFLAANISSNMADTQASASLNCLSKDLDRVLELFSEMLRSPGFQQDRIDLYKNQTSQAMERRNDQTEQIQSREWARLMRGDNHFSTAWDTKPSVDSITRQDLLDFHKQYYHPGNFLFAVSGDFNSQAMIAKLEKMLSDWSASKTHTSCSKTVLCPQPGVYMVNKPDVNQGQVSVGHLGTMRDNPDFYALSIMDDIPGGAGLLPVSCREYGPTKDSPTTLIQITDLRLLRRCLPGWLPI